MIYCVLSAAVVVSVLVAVSCVLFDLGTLWCGFLLGKGLLCV